jgi:hypothetical protein
MGQRLDSRFTLALATADGIICLNGCGFQIHRISNNLPCPLMRAGQIGLRLAYVWSLAIAVAPIEAIPIVTGQGTSGAENL